MREMTEISEAGRARRDEILCVALAAARSKRRRRFAGRAALAALPVLVLAGWLYPRSGRPAEIARNRVPAPSVEPAPTRPSPPAPRPAVVIQWVETDPTLPDRWAVGPRQAAPRATPLTDDQLLSRLAETGRPAGLVRLDGRATLVFGDGRDGRGPGL